MGAHLKFTGLALALALFIPIAGRADTQATPAPHRAHPKKKPAPAPLPSGTQGPVPQVPLDAIPAVAPEVTYENGLLTIVAPNSSLGDILRSVRKHTSADIEIPATANERVVTRLGPAPAREVMAELLNGSRFNYILLGSPGDANALVRVVLVAKTPDTPTGQPAQAAKGASPPVATNSAADADAEAAEENMDESADQSAAEAEQPGASPDQPGVKTPQQLLQEMQQRQMQMQQQQANQPGATPPVMPAPHQPQPQQEQ
jgi:hypothetical protein